MHNHDQGEQICRWAGAAASAAALAGAGAAWAESGGEDLKLAAVTPLPAVAAAAAPAASPFSANITLASQYVSRGFQQTWGEPALQGGFDYAHPSGFYAGTWMSSVSPHWIENGHLEWDVYAGYGGSAGDFSYKAGIYYYKYPGAINTFFGTIKPTKFDYGEILLGVSYKWINLNYWVTYTKDYFGYNSDTLFEGVDRHSRGSGYLDLNLNFDLGNDFGLLVHVGDQRVRNFGNWGFTDYKVALSKNLGEGWSATAAYTGMAKVNSYYRNGRNVSLTDRNEFSRPGSPQFLVSVTRAF